VIVLTLLVVLMIWLIPKVWRFLRFIVSRVLAVFGAVDHTRATPPKRSPDV
jgi:hypothetical protein